jgi:hypothetical protein
MKQYVTLLLVVALALFPEYAFAACPNRTCVGGPGPSGTCSTCYYYFDVNTSCPSVTNASTATMSCSWSGLQFGTGTGQVDWHMIVPTGHGGSCTLAQIWVDFYDPNGSSSNTLTATVFVTRGVTPVYSSQFFSRNGSQTQLTCAAFGSSTFTVQDGDRIDIQFDSNISVTGSGTPVIAVTTPLIWDNTGA